MKGIIVLAIKELIESKFGEDKWKEILIKAGIERQPIILPISDFDDQVVLKVIEAIQKVLGISREEVANAFGDYWVNEYSQRVYGHLYKSHKDAKSFITAMDKVHYDMTKNMPNAHPPRFEYEWINDKTLIIHYKSSRNMIDFMIGLIKGVGKFYKENIEV
ncbi:MAG: heme NO-binding domain-containing protein [Brevinematia bacterium]